MSHQAIIDDEGEAIKCCAICKTAKETISKLDKMLNEFDEKSSLLLDAETESLKNSILKEKSKLNIRIKELETLAQKQQSMGKISGEQSQVSKSKVIVNKASEILASCQELNGSKLLEYQTLLNKLLITKVEQRNKILQMMSSGTIIYSDEFAKKLNAVQDDVLRNYIYLEYIERENAGKSFEELYGQAKDKLDLELQNTISEKRESIINDAIERLKSNNVDEKTISEITNVKELNKDTINQLQENVNNEIVDEHIRKETIKSIIKVIEKRGFIVDRKNIKLQKDKNQVVVIAQKVNGQTAEFKVFLDGKFIYKFVNGYEGNACQKDIQPFIKDLDEIYGIKVKKTQTIWSNPDKISTQKYQSFKENKNNN